MTAVTDNKHLAEGALDADVAASLSDVRFVPIADIGDCWGTDLDAVRIRRMACADHNERPAHSAIRKKDRTVARLRRAPPRLCVDLPLLAVL